MKKLAFLAAALLALAPACGDDDDGETPIDAHPTIDAANTPDAMTPVDAAPDAAVLPNSGFVPPTEVTAAFEDGAEVAADWSCLGTPGVEVPVKTAFDVNGLVHKALPPGAGTPIDAAAVTMYPGFDFTAEGQEATTDADGLFVINVPADVERANTRWAFKVIAEGQVDSYLVNVPIPSAGAPAESPVDITSVGTTIIGLFENATGETIMEGKTVIAGSISDCAGNPVLHAVAMVSTTAGEQAHVVGADTYYFDQLPASHESQPDTNTDGLFVVINTPPAETSYLQVWGFVNDDDLADGEMTLLGELAMPTVADGFMTTGVEPLRTTPAP